MGEAAKRVPDRGAWVQGVLTYCAERGYDLGVEAEGYADSLYHSAIDELDGWWNGSFPSPADALEEDRECWDDD